MTLELPAAHLELGAARDHRSAGDDLSFPLLTVMSYRSVADRPAEADPVVMADGSERLRLNVPHPADFATRCLAFGVGLDCSDVVNELASASWFAHLRGTAIGPRSLVGRAGQCGDELLRLLGDLRPHVASIALPGAPTSAEFDLAFELGHLFRRQYGTFVVITSARADPGVARLGQACDCFIGGDGGSVHHHYPVRTVSDPASGRLICYDLYDVCCLWAGQLGEYGVLHSAADALHVEVSDTVLTLREVDELANSYVSQLSSPDNLELISVVGGAGLADAVPVSFWRNPLIRQDRTPGRHSTQRDAMNPP